MPSRSPLAAEQSRDQFEWWALGLIWYHPNYMRWSGCIEVYEEKGQWHGRLGRIGPFRGEYAHWPLQKDAPLPDPE